MNKIYVVMRAYYSDWEIHGFFTNREDADKWVATHGENEIVVELDCLDGKVDYSNVKIKYEYQIVFNKDDTGWRMLPCSEEEYQVYIADYLRSHTLITWNPRSYMRFLINIDKNDRKLAEKIAQDLLYMYLDSCDCKPDKKSVEDFNMILRQEEIEREERAEQERVRQEELAELARLKAKYEEVV